LIVPEYQAAVELLYSEAFALFPSPPDRERVLLQAVRTFKYGPFSKIFFSGLLSLRFFCFDFFFYRDAAGRLVGDSSGVCWGSTVTLPNGHVLVQIREQILSRGPFGLILLTLGYSS